MNDTLLFATGFEEIWKYKPIGTGIISTGAKISRSIFMSCDPNPANDHLAIHISLSKSTHASLILYNEQGKEMNIISNANKPKGEYDYQLNTDSFPPGLYYLVLMTHEDKEIKKIIVAH